MLLALCAMTVAAPADTAATYSGLQGQLHVAPPRIEASIAVDGVLDENVWQAAARLTDFSQYSPADGRAAEERTEVLVWYSPTAIHFGIRAYAQPGTVRAHLAARDAGIIPDDYIEIQLGTFNDGQRAFVFGVNPLGVQADGALVEGSAQQRSTVGQTDRAGREQADLSPDYTFDSKGRLTPFGYEVEVRIPFKSLRFPVAERQDWALHLIRKSAYSGREDTWAPVKRAAGSFLAQAGKLVGLAGLRRGLVLELNPIVTSSVAGQPEAGGIGWNYSGGRPEAGGNVKWGVTTNLTLNGTVNPDFSQVESDAGQVQPDPRQALFFAEKRPFFLDGLEYFSTPLQVIYTRRVAAPDAAVKVTGRVSGTSFGYLGGLDSRETSTSGRDHPVYNLLRLQRDLGARSRVGLAYTDRIEGGDYNRLAEVDGRFALGRITNLALNGAVSRTRVAGSTRTAPSWLANFSRTGRVFGLQAAFQGIHPDFQASSGFIQRGNIARANVAPSLTFYGKRGARLERFVGTYSWERTWVYDDFVAGRSSQIRWDHFQGSWTLRGGWTLGMMLLLESYGYDPALYTDYAIQVPTATGFDTIPYTGTPRLYNTDVNLSITTPQLAGFALSGFVLFGRDDNFFEWAPVNIRFGRVTLTFKPTERLRFEGSDNFISYHRPADGSVAGGTFIPRLKVEYQLSRAIFLRFVGEYRSSQRDSLRDDSRTNYPILIRDPKDGVYKRDLALASQTNTFRVDWLFSYQPTPGTVFFAGYGSSLSEPEAFRFRGLSRSQDGFFTKFSYLFRL